VTTGTTGSGSQTTTQPTATTEDEKDIIVLDMFYDRPELYNGWKWGEDPVTQEITAQSGIALNIRYATTSNHEELYTMIASGAGFPDLLYTNYIATLYDEEYILSLNDLADEHYPEFYDVLPYQYEEIHALGDGDIYYMNSTYCDSKKLETQIGGPRIIGVFVKNNIKWEAMGEPALETLEDIRAVALKAKEEGAEYPVLLTSYAWAVTSDLNSLQIARSSFAGPQFIYMQDNGVVTFNIKSDEYKKGAAYVNSLYQDGLIQADNFTFVGDNDDTVRRIAQAADPMIVIGHEWQLRKYRQGMEREGCYMAIHPPVAEGVNRSDIVLPDFNSSNIGSTGGIHVMYTTEYPKECIKFISYMLRDDIQIMCTHGREGVDYIVDYTNDKEHGRRILTDDLLKDLATMQNPEFMRKWGYFNNVLRMVMTRNTIIEYNRPYNEAFPEVNDDMLTTLGSIYGQPMKHLNLSVKFTDADEQLLYNNVIQEWTIGEAEMVLAPDDAAFEEAYNRTIANMERVGLSELEKIITERYLYWYELLEGK
jgi:ABC-type glycerol-3-phosphate transport system substrate-binding protein